MDKNLGKIMDKNFTRFICRQSVIAVLGENYQFTSSQYNRMNDVFKKYGAPKKFENSLTTVAYMIKYNLTNYVGRLARILELPASPGRYSYYLRYGRNYLPHLTQAKNKRTAHFKNRADYWINLGLSEKEARTKVSEVQKSRSANSPAAQKGATDYSIRCVGYWMKQGYTEEDAKKQVSKVQVRKWSAETVAAWMHTMASKPQHEKDEITLKRGHSIESNIARGHSPEEAERRSIAYYAKRNNYSKSSQAFFSLLESNLGHQDVFYKTKNYEKQFFGKCVDFYDAKSGAVIEYYGDFWHRNPQRYAADFVAYNKSSVEIWEANALRLDKIRQDIRVKCAIVVWERDVNKNPQEVITQILKEMKNGRN